MKIQQEISIEKKNKKRKRQRQRQRREKETKAGKNLKNQLPHFEQKLLKYQHIGA